MLTGIELIVLAFVLNTLKAPLRKRAVTTEAAPLAAQLSAIPWGVLNVIVCGWTFLSFWTGVVLVIWGACS